MSLLHDDAAADAATVQVDTGVTSTRDVMSLSNDYVTETREALPGTT